MWGFVIRDGEGDVITAGAGKITHVRDVFQAEVLACLAGARAAINNGIGLINGYLAAVCMN